MPLTNTHWGAYDVQVENGHVTSLVPFAHDRDPSAIGLPMAELLDHPTRIKAPCVRRSYLENGPSSGAPFHHSGELRGREPFVEVSWDEAERLVAAELERVRKAHGNQAIYAGSYGWASAGRFHHAQSQIHRFLNSIGGYTRSVNTYSYAAAEVIVPHVIGSFGHYLARHTTWEMLAQNCELVVAFGGLVLSNGQMGNGGAGRHIQRAGMQAAVAAGVDFINLSPRRMDVEDFASPRWIPVRPNTDTAMMLALCHTLRRDGLADDAFLASHTTGYEQFAAYIDGLNDGVVKDADWAASITGVDAASITALAHEMAAKKTLVSISWSLTRQHYGEQPYWAAITLAAMLGQIGTPGGGIGFGYAIANHIGSDYNALQYAALPQGTNAVTDFIPVARVSDMLLNPGGSFDYNGGTYRFPDIRMVYWAGGNPFHHHQDLNRLRRAWAKPETVVIHDWCWNASVKHADIVLPCTTPLEREDLGANPRDPFIMAMEKAVDPVGEARNDYDILCGIASHLGVAEAFSEGRSADDWLRWLWDKSCRRAKTEGISLPSYDVLKQQGYLELERPRSEPVMMSAFRSDPQKYPLRTPSGKIELFSETVAAFGYADCPGHATWNEPQEWLGAASPEFPLHMIGKQPPNKLHSQLDPGSHSQAAKVNGHEPVEIHPDDAKARGVSDGDLVRVYNARGSCLCTVRLCDALMPGVVAISTGAWYDPLDPQAEDSPCKHGNPNMLAPDLPTSRLAQGPGAHSCLVEICRYEGAPVTITAHQPPEILPRKA